MPYKSIQTLISVLTKANNAPTATTLSALCGQVSQCSIQMSYPPLAITVCVPMITLFTRDIIANTAESFITVVSMPDFAKLTANS